MTRDDAPFPSEAARLGRLLRRATPGTSRGSSTPELRRSFAAALATGRDVKAARAKPGNRTRTFWSCAAAGAAIAATLVVLSALRPAPALTFQIDGLSGGTAGSAGLEAQATLRTMRFSDGSVLKLERGARARILALDPRGARLAVERGDVAFDIRHRRETSWSVAAGPFEILVTGTAFNVSWTDDRRLRVRLREGAVLVRGSLVGAGVVVKAGQTLQAELDAGDVRLGTDDNPSPVIEATTPAIDTASANTPALAAPAATSPESEPPRPVWRSGSTRRPKPASKMARPAPQPARSDSLEDCLARCDDESLDALARGARRGGDLDVARKALLAVRTRHPASPLSHEAAFVLGRMEEDQDKPSEALSFYDAYLGEEGEGRYRPFALGRKMALVERLSGAAAARPIAEIYLRLYPNGAHGAHARHLLSTR